MRGLGTRHGNVDAAGCASNWINQNRVGSCRVKRLRGQIEVGEGTRRKRHLRAVRPLQIDGGQTERIPRQSHPDNLSLRAVERNHGVLPRHRHRDWQRCPVDRDTSGRVHDRKHARVHDADLHVRGIDGQGVGVIGGQADRISEHQRATAGVRGGNSDPVGPLDDESPLRGECGRGR